MALTQLSIQPTRKPYIVQYHIIARLGNLPTTRLRTAGSATPGLPEGPRRTHRIGFRAQLG